LLYLPGRSAAAVAGTPLPEVTADSHPTAALAAAVMHSAEATPARDFRAILLRHVHSPGAHFLDGHFPDGRFLDGPSRDAILLAVP